MDEYRRTTRAEAAKKRQQARRRSMNEADREKQRQINADRRRQARNQLSQEQRQHILAREAERRRAARQRLSEGQRKQIRARDAERRRAAKEHLSQEQRERILEDNAAQHREAYHRLSLEEKIPPIEQIRNNPQNGERSFSPCYEVMPSKQSSLGRLTRDAKRAREKRKRETTEQRLVRLKKHRERNLAARQAETEEQRQARLEAQKQRAIAQREALKRKQIQEQRLQEELLKKQHYEEKRLKKQQLEERRLKKQQRQNERLKKQHLLSQKLKSQQSQDWWQMDFTLSPQMTAKYIQSTSQMPVQQDRQVTQTSQNITKPAQMLVPPIQITPSKSKSVKNPIESTLSKSKTSKQLPLKYKLVIAGHQSRIMSNLASMWKNKKLCDISISNGSSSVMVHKIVLAAACPLFDTCIHSKVLEIKFPEIVSIEALNAFADYMYNGLLDLDLDILHQLNIIAKQLDIKDLEKLCEIHLLNGVNQKPASTALVFDDVNLMQSYLTSSTNEKTTPIQTSSLLIPLSNKFVTPALNDASDVNQHISKNELALPKEETAGGFEQEFHAASLDIKSIHSPVGSVIMPPVKIEPVGPEDDKYYQAAAVSLNSQTPSTTLNSTIGPTTEFILPFSDTTNSSNTTTNTVEI